MTDSMTDELCGKLPMSSRLLTLERPFFPSEQQSNTHGYRYPAVYGPSNLPGHEAARQNVYTLQEPDAANHN
jgi:hypothetical protein